MRFLCPIFCALAISTSSARADLLDDAIKAHQSGVPEVSITKLRQYLGTQPPEDRAGAAKLLLARCLLETQQIAEAGQALRNTTGHEATYLKAEQALRSGRSAEAGRYFSELIAPGTEFSIEARLGLAETQRLVGQLDAALQTLSPLMSDERSADPRAQLTAAEILLSQSNISKAAELVSHIRPASAKYEIEKTCLEGEIALKQGRLSEASASFSQVLEKPEDRTYRVIGLARLGLAKILVERQQFEEAEAELEKLISDQPRSAILGEMFENLFEIYSREENPETSELIRWAGEDPKASGPDRPAYALYYLMRLQIQVGLVTDAAQNCQKLLDRFSDHPVAIEGALTLARQQISSGHVDDANGLLQSVLERSKDLSPENRSRVEYLLGETNYLRGNVAAAREIFQKLSIASQYDRQNILFNWAVCSLQLGDVPSFEQAAQQLEALNPEKTLIAQLLFDKALIEAKSGSAAADETLQTLIRRFPQSPEIPRARLVLAEMRMMQRPPDLSGAQRALRQISTTGDPDVDEKSDRVKFFAAADDPSQNVRSVEALAEDYLLKYPDSPSRAEVRLKLGELYFRQNDFPNAQTQFELVREDSPDSPFVEPALFLAGEAARKSLNAASVDRAISLFEDVYKLGGPLKFQARLEEATTMRQTKREKEAIVLLEDLLTQNPPDDIRYEALDQKGEALFNLGLDDQKLYQQAIDAFDAVLQSNGLPVQWKEQALYQKGKCFEKLGRQDDALSAYYDVLATEGPVSDQLWYFRAGFDAAQILEDRRSWSSAAAIYEKLANTGGTRSDEAKERLTRLRLEHFLWPG
jgi:tetratricopeptide (TPR) repeat protein